MYKRLASELSAGMARVSCQMSALTTDCDIQSCHCHLERGHSQYLTHVEAVHSTAGCRQSCGNVHDTNCDMVQLHHSRYRVCPNRKLLLIFKDPDIIIIMNASPAWNVVKPLYSHEEKTLQGAHKWCIDYLHCATFTC
jgi:hypothetical protein